MWFNYPSFRYIPQTDRLRLFPKKILGTVPILQMKKLGFSLRTSAKSEPKYHLLVDWFGLLKVFIWFITFISLSFSSFLLENVDENVDFFERLRTWLFSSQIAVNKWELGEMRSKGQMVSEYCSDAQRKQQDVYKRWIENKIEQSETMWNNRQHTLNNVCQTWIVQ